MHGGEAKLEEEAKAERSREASPGRDEGLALPAEEPLQTWTGSARKHSLTPVW